MATTYTVIYGRAAPPKIEVVDPDDPIDTTGCKRCILIVRNDGADAARYDIDVNETPTPNEVIGG